MQQASGWQTYRRLLGYSLQNKGVLLFGVLTTILYAMIEVGIVSSFENLIDTVFKSGKLEYFLFAGVFFVTLILLRGLMSFFSTYCMEWVGRQIVFALRTELFNKYLKKPIEFFDKNPSGELVSKITYNAETVSQAATQAIVSIFKNTATVTFALAKMFLLSWTLALTFLVTAPVIAIIVNLTSKRFRTISQRIQNSMGDVTQIATEGVDGIKVIKTFGAQSFESQQMIEAANKNRQQLLKLTITKAVSSPIIQFIAALGFALVFWRAGFEFLDGRMTEGQFTTFFLLIMMLMKPLKELSSINSILQRGIAGAESIFKVIDTPDEKDSGTVELAKVSGAIEFNQVNFGYSKDSPVIKNFSLNIKPGQTVALVGPSGSGKSTITSLLLKFYHPNTGSVLLEGMDIEDIQLDSLREQFAYVSQQITLFNGTVKENIAYGSLADKSDEQLQNAIDNAYLADVIESLDDGIETNVGNAGSKLSGGQRQRIAIARALLKDAPILILDEATSALDNESERKIQQALSHLMKDRTTLVIAHRLSTIENADQIVVLKDGEIVEQGSHTELLTKSGEYQKLYNMQFAD